MRNGVWGYMRVLMYLFGEFSKEDGLLKVIGRELKAGSQAAAVVA